MKGVINMASSEQLIKVAMNCSKYNPEDFNTLSSSTSTKKDTLKNPSCEHCTHYTAERRCNLDLIDKIMSSMAMELK